MPIRKTKKRYIAAILLTIAAVVLSLWYIREFEVLPLPAFYLLDDLPAPTNKDKILVIAPHPDDETLGAGGLIRRGVDSGAHLKIIIATDGNKHGLKSLRREEEIKAMRVLGVPDEDIVFFDFPDGDLNSFQNQFTEKLRLQTEQFKPTIIVSTYPADIHPDHAAAGKAVDNIVKGLTKKPILYQFIVHYHRYPRPEGFRPHSFLLPPVKLISTNTTWRKFVLTPEEQTYKNEAILQYKSQLSRKNLILRELLLSFVRQNELFVLQKP